MNRFKDIITQLVVEGYSTEDIAKGFSDEINKIETAKKQEKERDEYARQLYEDWSLDEELSTDSLTKYVTYEMSMKHPKWPIDVLEIFYDTTKTALALTERACNAAVDGDIVGVLIDELEKAIKESGSLKTDEDIITNFLNSL